MALTVRRSRSLWVGVTGQQELTSPRSPADVEKPEETERYRRPAFIASLPFRIRVPAELDEPRVREQLRRWRTRSFEAGCLMVIGSNAITAGAWSGSGSLM